MWAVNLKKKVKREFLNSLENTNHVREFSTELQTEKIFSVTLPKCDSTEDSQHFQKFYKTFAAVPEDSQHFQKFYKTFAAVPVFSIVIGSRLGKSNC